MKDKVAVIKVNDIYGDLKEAIYLAGGFDVSDNDFIVIKPNLCDFRPSYEGGTTDPRIVESFIKILREKSNPRIAIVESDHAVGDASDEFERLGYRKLAQDLDVELINLTTDDRVQIAWDGYYFETIDVPETLLKATKIISISKLKTHVQQKMTCSMKNLFGLIPKKRKSKYHAFMNEVLADLTEFYRPCLSIIDGIVGMEGFGPSDGDRKNSGIIICGKDPIATDAIAAKIMGFNPRSVPYLKFAEHVGLANLSDIDIIGNAEFNDRFSFIPFYSYWSYRVSFMISRIGIKLGTNIEGFSKFVSQAAVGFIVLKDGYFFTPDFGMLFRNNAFSYAKGMLLRPCILARMKLRGIL